MTPVQLPEVPVGLLENVIRDEIDSHCPQGKWVTGPNTLALCLKVEMAAQLREYATEAVMAERRRLMGLVAEWRTEDMPGETVAFWLVADQLEERITPSETNSER